MQLILVQIQDKTKVCLVMHFLHADLYLKFIQNRT